MQKWQQPGEGGGRKKKKVCLHSELAFIGSAYVPWANPEFLEDIQADKQVPGKCVPHYDFFYCFWVRLGNHCSGAYLLGAGRQDWTTTTCSLLKAMNRISFSQLFTAEQVAAP